MKLFLINTFFFYPEAGITEVRKKSHYQLDFIQYMLKIFYSLIWGGFSSLSPPILRDKRRAKGLYPVLVYTDYVILNSIF